MAKKQWIKQLTEMRERIMARNWSGHTKPPLGYGHKK